MKNTTVSMNSLFAKDLWTIDTSVTIGVDKFYKILHDTML